MAVPISPPPPRVRIYSHMTRSRFIHLEDALLMKTPKIRLFAGEFARGQGMKASAFHFLDLDDARVLLADLAWGRSVKFVDYKGSETSGETISRSLKVETKDSQVWFEVQNGLGERIGAGAVKPAGAPLADVSIPLTVQEARRLAHASLAYIHAWDVSQMWLTRMGRW